MWLLLLGLAHGSTGDLYDDPLNASEPLAIKLDLEIDPRESVFHGVVDADIAVHKGTDVIGITGWGMDYHDVDLVIDGSKKAPRKGGSLELTWNKSQAGAGTVRIGYDGTLWTTKSTGLVRQRVGDAWHVTSRLYPDEAPYLLPLNNHAKHHVPWTISARVPVGMHALSNGVVTSDLPDGDGWHKVTFATTPNLANREVALAVGPFRAVKIGTVGKASVPVTVWLPAGADADLAWMKTEIASLVTALEASTGVGYPDVKLDIVAVDGQLDAVHHYGLTTIGLDTIDLAPDAPINKRVTGVRLLANELAAAWTGGHRSPTSLDHIWLRSGIGSWLADRAVFSIHEDWSAADYMADDVQLLMMYAETEPDRAARSNFGTRRMRYTLKHPVHSLRGAAAMRSMQALYGDQAIDQVMNAYFSGKRQPVTVRNLDDIVRQKLGKQALVDLDRLLNYSDVSTVTASAHCPDGRPARIRLQHTVAQQAPAQQAPAQRLPVCVRWGGGASGPGDSCLVLEDGRGLIVIDNHGAPPPRTDDPTDDSATAQNAAAEDPVEPAPLQPSPNCPTWTIANAGGTGLYRVSRTLDEAKELMQSELSSGERSNIAADAMAQLPFDEVLALQPALFEHPNRFALDLHGIERYSEAVPDAMQAQWRTLLQKGLADRFTDDALHVHRGPLHQALHTKSIQLSAIQLANDALIDDAEEKSQRWIDNFDKSGSKAPNPLKKYAGEPDVKHRPTREVLSIYLPIAMYHGRIDNINKLTAHLLIVRDPDLRAAFVRALANERSADRVEKILDNLVKLRVGSSDIRVMLEGALASESTRPVAQAFIDDQLDMLARRMQQPDRTSLIRLGNVGCYQGQADDILRLFARRAVDWPGGPAAVDAAVARADNCGAQNKKDEQAMSAWLQSH